MPTAPHLQPDTSSQAAIPSGLVEALMSAYAELVRRQRTASAAFVRWTAPHARAHEFCWIENGAEILISSAKEVRIRSKDAIFDSVRKMMATIELNPYERELLYGYPYVVGYVDGKPIRAPLLTLPISIIADADAIIVKPNDETVRFNSLPFRSDLNSAAHELAPDRLIDATPDFPVNAAELQRFCGSLAREMKVEIGASLDGSLKPPPAQPRKESALRIIDAAACFVAPKTSYFLASDLDNIGTPGRDSVALTALGWLLSQRSHQATSNVFHDSRSVFFPFPSNASQRRVALLADEEEENRIIVVQGPPGTGKSLTIANVACHLVAMGKRVLVCSQKDKALSVVDQTLRQLELAQLPMTLLRQDADSRRELRDRLDSIQKNRSVEDTRRDAETAESNHLRTASQHETTTTSLRKALHAEHIVASAHRELTDASTVLRRLTAQWRLFHASRQARKKAPIHSDVLGSTATELRHNLLNAASRVLTTAAEHRTGEASRGERNQLREFSKLLARNQTNAKNFSVFDRLKREPTKCQMLLKVLPCWIMSPDDVARLFPCEPGLFDTVIIDEASQCDLPSMAPVLFRAKQAIIAGDSKQMQAQRFAFTSTQVASQAWREHGLDKLDPDRWLDPARVDLLHLASVRVDEEALLDEHYRSLPPIIGFSNERWYGNRLRLMRDDQDRRVGDPDSAVITLHHCAEGFVNPGTQENELEAKELVSALGRQLRDPGYSDASFGVICLFEEQMRLVNDLVAEMIDDELRASHDLVVVNPDGFQGDERDVILYSLSYDANGMEKAALSARQAEREHIQGMLNVAFTRAREEIHIFHSAPIQEFGNAAGKGAILDWLNYCQSHSGARASQGRSVVQSAQSQFEADVASALQSRGAAVVSQYPCCGFFIDLVATVEEQRLAIECDGEVWHLDEHGELKAEDLYRQEILERAGWRVLRIPYRAWRKNPDAQIVRVMDAFTPPADGNEPEPSDKAPEKSPDRSGPAPSLRLNRYEAAIFHAVRR
jgi:very-short-patch-repair endonuclease